MRIGAFSFAPRRGDVEGNLAVVLDGLSEASATGCRLVVLPEMWTTSFAEFGDAGAARELCERSESALDQVAAFTEQHDVVVAGTAPALREDALPFNRLTLFARGQRLLDYDKLHLFTPTAEELNFSAGDLPPTCIEPEHTGLPPMTGATCYDLRFSETFKPAVRAGAELIVCPAQWPTPRIAHWRALLPGCAVEHQSFVVGCNRTGTELVGRRQLELVFPGHSMVVDPNGEILAEGGPETGLISAEVDFELVRRLRTRVPIKKDRRDELYRSW